MGKIHIFRSKTLRFLFYSAFYLSILLALLYLYGFKDSFTGTFIYNDFLGRELMKSIIEQIDYWAINTPDTIAFQNSDYSLTYKTLKQQSDAIASWMIKNNFTNKPVIVYGHMQAEMISIFLGSVKAGCAYIPVDESIPFERLKKMITNSGANLLITPKDITLEFDSINIINFGELQKIIESTDLVKSLTDFNVKDDETFYIIYTSGSTGDPKGVQITEKNLRSFTNWILKDFNIYNGQRFLM